MAPRLPPIVLRIVIVALLAFPLIAFLDYVLPHHAVLRVVGTQVKHTVQGKSAQGSDVYYIFAEDPQTKKPHVFRNEDTRWGFPWYLKFNSADIQAAAQSIADERETAMFTYYGWRFQIFSLFPNVTRIVRASPDAWAIPWFQLAFFAIVLGGGTWLFLMARRWRARRSH